MSTLLPEIPNGPGSSVINQGSNTMTIRDYDPTHGQAYQGDVAIVPVPAKLASTLDTTDEIAPIDGRLILQEGEVSGHHHAVRLPRPVMFRDDGLARDLAASAPVAIGTARHYRDPKLAEAMVLSGPLTRSDLCVAFLRVEGAPVTVTHEEHDGIRVPPGLFYVGRQIESAGAEERVVRD